MKSAYNLTQDYILGCVVVEVEIFLVLICSRNHLNKYLLPES